MCKAKTTTGTTGDFCHDHQAPLSEATKIANSIQLLIESDNYLSMPTTAFPKFTTAQQEIHREYMKKETTKCIHKYTPMLTKDKANEFLADLEEDDMCSLSYFQEITKSITSKRHPLRYQACMELCKIYICSYLGIYTKERREQLPLACTVVKLVQTIRLYQRSKELAQQYTNLEQTILDTNVLHPTITSYVLMTYLMIQ
jgi:hypothetical protein